MTPQVVHEGTIVLMDGGCTVEGYQSDITRTYVLGKASRQDEQVFDIVLRAQSAALAAARPGAECGSVDAAARKVVTDAGYGPDYKYFTHRLGHGFGMDGHEWPYLVRGNPVKLQANMTTSNEPGIYIRGEFGVRIEDDMHITENGAELFTPQTGVAGRSVRCRPLEVRFTTKATKVHEGTHDLLREPSCPSWFTNSRFRLSPPARAGSPGSLSRTCCRCSRDIRCRFRW